MAELFGETFASKDMDNKTPADIIKEEVTSYLAASGITVDGDPLTWWESNECKYPHFAKMARCYLTSFSLQFLPRGCSQQQGT